MNRSRRPHGRRHADELLRRALIDADASAAVALRVAGLPLCDTLTVVFHGRRDLGTIQTYVAHGGRGAGSASAPDELMRVPCDLDLARPRTARRPSPPTPSRRPMRDALDGADTVLDIWREPLEDLAQARAWTSTAASRSTSGCPPTGCCPRARRARTRGSSSPPSARRARSRRASRRWASSARSRTSRASTRCPTTPSAASEDFLERSPPSTPAASGAARPPGAVGARFLELSGDGFAGHGARPRTWRGMRRRPAILIAAGFGLFVFLGLSFLLARGLTGASAERGEGARRARGAGARRRRRGARELPACRRSPPARRSARSAARAAPRPAACRSSTTAEHAAVAHAPDRLGACRLARGGELPVVQCVRVRREGPLTGGGVELLAISDPIGSRPAADQPAGLPAAGRCPGGPRPAQRARCASRSLPWSRRRVRGRRGVGQRDAARRRGFGLEGRRSLPPPPPPSSSSGGFHGDVSERRNIRKSTTPRARAMTWSARR